MTDISYRKRTRNTAFTLAEVLAALTIGSMVLVAVLGIYGRAEKTAASITRKLDNAQLPGEVLHRIAEDLDEIVGTNSDTKIVIRNKYDNLYPSARLEITKTIHDSKNKPLTFEKIIWQSSYDYDSWTEGLVLYRSHSGITVEDKLLDQQREDWEKEYSFVPICDGITFFKIQVPRDEEFLEQWTTRALPKGVAVTISFAESFKAIDGTFDVLDEEKITRTMAIDRSRKINFEVVKRDYDLQDPNSAEDQDSEQDGESKEDQTTETEQEDEEQDDEQQRPENP